jgi:CRP/FNR family transcriptional regulator
MTEAERKDPLCAILGVLRRARLFEGLGEETLREMARMSRLRRLHKDQVLFRQDQDSFGIFIVDHGAVSLHREGGCCRDRILCVFGPGDSLAEGTLSPASNYPATATAMVPSRVLILDRVRFLDALPRHPPLAMRLLESMNRRMRFLVCKLESLQAMDAECRLAQWLCLRHSCQGQAGQVRPAGTKQQLAAELGITPETLSRSLGRLRERKLIRIEGRRIAILDREGLERAARPQNGTALRPSR